MGDVLVTPQVSDVLVQLLTQDQQLVQFGNVEEIFCNRDVRSHQGFILPLHENVLEVDQQNRVTQKLMNTSSNQGIYTNL